MNSPKCTFKIFIDSQAIKQRVSEGMTDRKAVVDLLVPGRLPRVRAIISRQRVRLVSDNQRRNVRYVYLQIIDDSDVRLGVKDNVDDGGCIWWQATGPAVRVILCSPWGMGRRKKSMAQVYFRCAAYICQSS